MSKLWLLAPWAEIQGFISWTKGVQCCKNFFSALDMRLRHDHAVITTLYFTLSFQNGHQVTFGATIPVSHEVSRRFTGTITVATIHAAKWRIHSVENARGAALVARLRRVCVLKNIACRVSRNIKRTASTLSEKYSGKNEKS